MHCPSSGALLNLFATTEAVGNDQSFRRCSPDSRQQLKIPNRDRNIVFVVFKTEGTGHSATALRGSCEIEPQAPQHRLFIRHLQNRLVMAVSVNERLSSNL